RALHNSKHCHLLGLLARAPHADSSFRVRHPPGSPLFPYTTLFRSNPMARRSAGPGGSGAPVRPGMPRRTAPRRGRWAESAAATRSEEHTSELQSLTNLVCRLLLEKKNHTDTTPPSSNHLFRLRTSS